MIEPKPNILATLNDPVKIKPNNIQYKNIKALQENVLAIDLIFVSAMKIIFYLRHF